MPTSFNPSNKALCTSLSKKFDAVVCSMGTLKPNQLDRNFSNNPNVEDGLDFLLDTPLDFLIPQDPERDAAELFGVIGMPSSYLVSPDGNVELVHMGFRNGDINVIEEEIKKVLQEN